MKSAKRIAAKLILLFTAMIVMSAASSENGVESLRQTSKAFAAVARKVSPSVVSIRVEGNTSSTRLTPFDDEWPFDNDFFRRFFGDDFPNAPRQKRSQKPRSNRRVIGQGSGFVFKTGQEALAGKTYLLTNNHVVKNAGKISVQFKDGREFDAKVTGRDPHSDIAVIEINATGFASLALADSSAIEVGEWVVAIGNPFGLSHTLTAGIVSAKGRTSVGINDYEDFIQTDAAINPGNSGGPLVNLDGEVVGINTAIFSRSGGHMGIGFAIPSNLANTIATQLIEHGEVTRGFLGIVVQPLTSELADMFGVKSSRGILVAKVAENSPAEKAGLRQGDVILTFRDQPVTDIGHFRNQVALTPPGKQVSLTVLRNGKTQLLRAKLGELTEDRKAAQGDEGSASEIGINVQTITPELAQRFEARSGEGVVVTEVKPGSIASLAGIRAGTIILQANKKPVNNAQAFEQAIKQSASTKRALLLVRSGDMQRFVALAW